MVRATARVREVISLEASPSKTGCPLRLAAGRKSETRSVSLEDWWSSLFGCRNKERGPELEVISLEASPSKTGGPLRLAAGIKSEDQNSRSFL
ncbi:hypothetical protein OPV22_007471 [Ensete ventricosum]|uniref:Uncharacterized protein n=1 Tax=Ensete ventricosum TaxID=4639 RepID=A0AAV8RT73_ENSVE|nr:hypothetical protein OPV22_007471 [Ensete ventricosum]